MNVVSLAKTSHLHDVFLNIRCSGLEYRLPRFFGFQLKQFCIMVSEYFPVRGSCFQLKQFCNGAGIITPLQIEIVQIGVRASTTASATGLPHQTHDCLQI